MKIRKNGVWEDYKYPIYESATDTITSLPEDIIADGNNAEVLIKGNMQQSGTPTPQNPIQPSECGERTGNLVDENAIQNGYYVSSGSISTFTSDDRYRAFQMPIKAGTYTIKIQADEGIRLLRIATANEFYNVQEDNRAYTFVISSDTIVYVSWRNLQTTNSFTNMTVMLNTGSTALPYEPYGIKIPISSANTTTPVYLGEVQTTRKIKKLVLTGEENFQNHSSISGLFTLTSITDYLFVNATTTLSTHYNSVSNYGSSYVPNGCLAFFWGSGRTERILYIHDDAYTTAADFKSYLAQQYSAGTPVTVWYVLAEPTTGIVNEPIRKIGDYADTISNVAEIPTTAGEQTFDVQTTLKPSSVEITYKGWHKHTPKEYDNGSWS